jgi:hypothetical protein
VIGSGFILFPPSLVFLPAWTQLTQKNKAFQHSSFAIMAAPGNMVLDGDPRYNEKFPTDDDAKLAAESPVGNGHSNGHATGLIRPQQRKLHDTNVTFEEYHYYASLTRAEEEQHPRHGRETSLWALIFPSKSDGGAEHSAADPKRNLSNPNTRSVVSDEEWSNASRALRTATRGAIFYLITTDILGPFGLPYAFATMGWG